MITISPSKNRLDFTIDKVLGESIEMVLEPQDVEKYKGRIKGNIFILSKNDMGFGFMMYSIINHYSLLGYRYLLFADDDIFGLKTRAGKQVDLNNFLMEGYSIMKTNDYAQLMVSFSGHNWYYKNKIKENVGCWGMLFIDTEKIKKVGNYDINLKIFNDWDMSARLIKEGYKTACWYDYKFEHKMKSKQGGAMSCYNDKELMKRQCVYLENKFGSDKVKTIFHEKHNIFEVRFKWRKLLKDK